MFFLQQKGTHKGRMQSSSEGDKRGGSKGGVAIKKKQFLRTKRYKKAATKRGENWFRVKIKLKSTAPVKQKRIEDREKKKARRQNKDEKL